ncbi:relaxase family protein [Phytohabitans suffuscus]
MAGEVMAAVGLAPYRDSMAVRWLAVRHNDDHIHLVATLVRQDRRTAWPWQDKRKAQAACRDLEKRYGLYQVAPPGQGSRRWPSPAELNKAARLDAKGRTVVPRDELRRRVRAVAAVAVDETDFFARLTGDGVLVRRRYSVKHLGEVTGYAVGLAGHTTAAGATVWYGGGRLAADLTLPRLRTQWTGASPQSRPTAAQLAAQGSAAPLGLYQRAAEHVRQATAALAAADGPAVVSAFGDLLSAIAQTWEGAAGGPLADAVDPSTVPPTIGTGRHLSEAGPRDTCGRWPALSPWPGRCPTTRTS